MAKPIQDDFSEVLLDAENDAVFSLTVVRRDVEPETAKRRLMKLEFDIGQESFAELILKPFEGKKVLKNWQTYIPPTEEGKAKGQKGTWIRSRK